MATVAFRCPHLAATLSLPSTVVGKRIKCPKCHNAGTVGGPPKPAVVAPTVGETRDFSNPDDESRLDPADDDEIDEPASSLDFLRPAQSRDELGRLGNFRVLRELGRGGMGVVLLAEDLKLGRQVALKVMLPQHAARAKAKERFLREAKTAASIENDHIITIHQVDEDNGVPFLAMPVLKGEPLNVRLRRDRRVPVAEAVRIGWQICDGLQAAHDHKLVHRDLKPGNLWIESPRGRVKILDFGLALPVEANQHLTRTGAVVGTPTYMAPEQARNPHVDFRADLFSLGVILYQMLTGRVPFKGHDALSTMMSICNDPIEPPAKWLPGLPVEMNALVLKLLDKDPARRFDSAEQVAQVLEAINDKHFGGRGGPPSDSKSHPPSGAPMALPVAPIVPVAPVTPPSGTPMPTYEPTEEESNPFTFRAKRSNKLVSLSSSGEMTTPFPAENPAAPPRNPARMWPWMLAAGGFMAAIAAVVLVVVLRRDDVSQPVAEPNIPKDVMVATVDPMKEKRVEPPKVQPSSEPVAEPTAHAEVDDPFPQFDPTPLPAWKSAKGAPKPALAPFDAKQAKKHQEEWAAYLKKPVVITNSMGMKLALVPPGEFDLVQTRNGGQVTDVLPTHRIRLTHGYHLGTTEVTNTQFGRFVAATKYKTEAETPGRGGRGVIADFVGADWITEKPEYNWRRPGPGETSPQAPVVHVTRKDAMAFCEWLSKQDKVVYRLPTEAEWEYACRAGSNTPRGVCGPNEDIWNYAWGRAQVTLPIWEKSSPLRPVGLKLPNSFGLHDMLGNAWEMCADDLAPSSNPASISAEDSWGLRRVSWRGGAWDSDPRFLYPGLRKAEAEANTTGGFRVLRQIGPVDETPSRRPILVAKNAPLSPTAFVARPQPISGLRSWTIQPVLGAEGILRCQPGGGLIATAGSGDMAIRLWSEKGELVRVLLGHDEFIRSMRFSPNGKLLVTGQRTAVRVWDVETGACIANWKHTGERVAFAPDSRHVIAFEPHAANMPDGLPYRLWDLKDGSCVDSTAIGDLIAWSPSGDRAIVASRLEKLPRLQVIVPGSSTPKTDLLAPEESRDPARSQYRDIAWSPDGKTLSALDAAGRIHLWDAVTLKHRGFIQTIGSALSWSDDSSRIYAWEASTIATVDPVAGNEIAKVKIAAFGSMDWRTLGKTVAVAANKIVLASAEDGKVLVNGRERGKVDANPKWGVVGDKKKSVAVCVDAGNLWTFDLDNGALAAKRTWFHPGKMIPAPHGAVAIPSPKGLLLTNADLSKPPTEIPGAKAPIDAAVWSPTGKYLAAAGRDHDIWVWHASSNTLLKHSEDGAKTIALAWSADEKRLATLDAKRIIRIWDAKSWKAEQSLTAFEKTGPPPSRIVWSMDGKSLFVTLGNGARTIDVETGAPGDMKPYGYTNIPGVFGGPGFKNYVLYGNDGNAWLFDSDIARRRSVGIFGESVQFLDDGRRFVAGLDKRGWLQAYDMKTHARLGTLIPKMTGNHWIAIGPDGHYAGSDGVEDHIVYVALTEDGKQETYAPAEFERRFGWRNESSKARFAALPEFEKR